MGDSSEIGLNDVPRLGSLFGFAMGMMMQMMVDEIMNGCWQMVPELGSCN